MVHGSTNGHVASILAHAHHRTAPELSGCFSMTILIIVIIVIVITSRESNSTAKMLAFGRPGESRYLPLRILLFRLIRMAWDVDHPKVLYSYIPPAPTLQNPGRTCITAADLRSSNTVLSNLAVSHAALLAVMPHTYLWEHGKMAGARRQTPARFSLFA
ncbi:hypothetical protein B2J93_2912 [Marssonina coronariae]|uniref:Uncharacterized protein n=1 Tax=Diplocarpon coronariae TaxID=2795749 RepID=A0A218YVW6_9HELO|nr:hypothetical protein B2J93_2912 [Marssonina coronariae]